MATFLEIANRVQDRLREKRSATLQLTDQRVLQLKTVINDAKREVEDAHIWPALMLEIDVAISGGTEQYSLSGLSTDRAFEIQQVVDLTAKNHVRNVDQDYFHLQRDVHATLTGPPQWYQIIPPSSGTTPRVEFFPAPSDGRTVRFHVSTPQADLSADADVPLISSHLVELLSYAKLYSERGEAVSTVPLLGDPISQYEKALATAIQMAKNNNADTGDWYVRRIPAL